MKSLLFIITILCCLELLSMCRPRKENPSSAMIIDTLANAPEVLISETVDSILIEPMYYDSARSMLQDWDKNHEVPRLPERQSLPEEPRN